MQENLSIERSKEGQAAQTVRIKPKWHMVALHIVYYLIMVAFILFYMLPFWGAVMTSFKTNDSVMSTTPVTPPTEWTLDGYAKALDELGVPLLNSLAVTLFGAAGSVFLGSICAYALSKWKFKLNNVFFIALVAATYLPFQAILIPLLRTIKDLDLYDNIWGLVLVHSVFGMPMCTTMMRGYYADVPDALIRQAMVDGNGMWQIYRKIVLPNTKIATITVFVFQCTSIWNEMLFALVLGGFDSKPATIALNELAGTMAAEFNVQMAGSLILALPMLIIYIFMGKYLISGQMSGAVTAS
ncbi:MAG: carbohydrate ABC transporter permease [Clostridia bacterium]|jgi:glucose/mannose transport system permease protein|nr:carbohydrate ABC transporter permease [Clostridia bacterium]